ncbi:MAG: transposase [Desulfobacterales bacterium]|nr:transposase [Desulfobacterales bacterium]
MARPLRIIFPGAFYHVTSRGNERKPIYKSKQDREKFLEYLGEAYAGYGAIIHAFCLMINHYHLLVETPDANLPQIMKPYTAYFNIKRKRSGHRSDPGLPALRFLEYKLSLDHISQLVRREIHDFKLIRKVEIYLVKRFSGEPLKAIGDRYNLSSSGVSKICSRFVQEYQKNPKLKKVVDGVVLSLYG